MMHLDCWKIIKDVFGKNKYDLEVYPVKERSPFAVICAGGGYNMVCSFVEGRPYARALNKAGYTAFVLKYRVGDLARYPAPQEDLARAVRFILDHAQELNVKKENYAVVGSSAGGHLAASFGTETMGYGNYGLPKPATLILAYPVICMDERGHGESTQKLLGLNPTSEEMYAKSIHNCVTPQYPPTFIWNSDGDTVVPPVNSRLMAEALKSAGVKYEYHNYPNVRHGAGLARGSSAAEWFSRAVTFWESCMKE